MVREQIARNNAKKAARVFEQERVRSEAATNNAVDVSTDEMANAAIKEVLENRGASYNEEEANNESQKIC